MNQSNETDKYFLNTTNRPSIDNQGWRRIFEWEPFYNTASFELQCNRSFTGGAPLSYTINVQLNNQSTSNQAYSLITKPASYSSDYPQAYKLRISIRTDDSGNKRQGIDIYIGRPDELTPISSNDSFSFTLSKFRSDYRTSDIVKTISPVSMNVNDMSTDAVVFDIRNYPSINTIFERYLFMLSTKGDHQILSGNKMFMTYRFLNNSKFVIRITATQNYECLNFLLFSTANIIAYSIIFNGANNDRTLNSYRRTNIHTYTTVGDQKNINNFTEEIATDRSYIDIKNGNVFDNLVLFGYSTAGAEIKQLDWYDNPTT